MMKSEIIQKTLIMTLTCSKILSEQNSIKKNIPRNPNLCISVPPGDIVQMSHNKIGIFADLTSTKSQLS